MLKFVLALTLVVTNLAYAESEITWKALVPVVEQGLLEGISAADKNLISEINAYKTEQQNRQLSAIELDGYKQRKELAQKRGLDVTALLKQHELIASNSKAILPDLKLDDIKIGGYLVPLETTGLVGTQFILVPTAGACIHYPPPPVNQTIIVDIPEGYALENLYAPVWVKGNIEAKNMTQSLALSDGNQAVQTGYSIQADEIVDYL